MSNRYLYRAKRKDNGEWVEGYYACYINRCGSEDKENHTIRGRKNFLYFVDPSTICQCTGLNDNNSKPIFEHDILNLSMSGKVEVKFNDGVWGADFGDGCIFPMRSSLFGEGGVVIGNIFDNPELLEVEE